MVKLETLTIEVTNKCNERCIHCYLPDRLKEVGTKLKEETIYELLGEFVNIGGENVLFTGGEVTLFPHIEEILRYAHSKGLWISIQTNGMRCNEQFISVLREIEVNDVQVSLYSINPEVHDAITKFTGSCVQTMKSIEMLVKTGIPVRIACSVLKENWKDAASVFSYAKELGIKVAFEFNIIAREDHDLTNLCHRVSIEELEKCLYALMNCDKEYTLKMLHRGKREENEIEDIQEDSICGAAQGMLYIKADGSLAVCPGWEIKLSNTKTIPSLKEFWENNELLNSIRLIKERSFPKCLKCEAREFCVRCFARNYLETGDYTQIPHYACEYAFMVKRIVEEFI